MAEQNNDQFSGEFSKLYTMIKQDMKVNQMSATDKPQKVKDGLSCDITDTRNIFEQNRKDTNSRMARLESLIDNQILKHNVPSASEILVLTEENATEHEANMAKNGKISPEVLHYISLATESRTAIQSVEWLFQQMLENIEMYSYELLSPINAIIGPRNEILSGLLTFKTKQNSLEGRKE